MQNKLISIIYFFLLIYMYFLYKGLVASFFTMKDDFKIIEKKVFFPNGETIRNIDVLFVDRVDNIQNSNNVYKFPDGTIVQLDVTLYNPYLYSWGKIKIPFYLNQDCSGQAYTVEEYNTDRYNEIIQIPGGFMKPTGSELQLTGISNIYRFQDNLCVLYSGNYDLLPLNSNYNVPLSIPIFIPSGSYIDFNIWKSI